MSVLLEIEDLHARVGDKEVIKGLNLTINEGEVHAIMGPNGAGKSTLSYVLSGKPGYEVTSGTIRFKGADLCALSTEERAREGVPGRNSRRTGFYFFETRGQRRTQTPKSSGTGYF